MTPAIGFTRCSMLYSLSAALTLPAELADTDGKMFGEDIELQQG
jgi:hypothetical protein